MALIVLMLVIDKYNDKHCVWFSVMFTFHDLYWHSVDSHLRDCQIGKCEPRLPSAIVKAIPHTLANGFICYNVSGLFIKLQV